MSLAFKEVFQAVDHSDTEKLLDNLSDDAVFQFANMSAVKGKENIRQLLDQFFASIDHTKHSDLELWGNDEGDKYTVKGNVMYVRKDGSQLEVPFCNVFVLDDQKQAIREYLIYVDNSELYN